MKCNNPIEAYYLLRPEEAWVLSFFRTCLGFGGEGRNRTNQGSRTTLNGFEDRGGHQAPITLLF